MKALSTLALAGRRLLQRPVRSLLLLQGTVWGVAVAVFPSAVIEGTREAAMTRGRALGADRVSLAADPTVQDTTGLRLEDLAIVRTALADADVDASETGAVRLLALFEAGGDESDRPAALVAATPGAAPARGLELASGRWLRPDDGPTAAVVEADVARWLGRDPLAPGDRFRLPGRDETLEVVGVARPRSPALARTNDLGFDVEHPLYHTIGRQLLWALGIPYVADAWKRSDRTVWVPFRGSAVDWMFLRVGRGGVREAADAAAEALVEVGRSPVAFHPLVLPLVMGREIDRFGAVQYALFLACLAMGAVVMANVGLLVALRRRAEIAVRRVEGATRLDIATHFVFEGVLLTAVGAVLGCFLGMGLAAIRVSLEPVTGFTWRFPWTEGLLAVGVALVVGVGAALLPAWRAARQDPVRALVDA